jgi:hemerythrin-like domain-containing protein
LACKDKIRLIESRRLTEANTFTNDIQSIKKRVINFERYIKRLKKHVDEEKTAELITELENTDVAQVDMDQLISDIKKIEEEVVDAKRFKLPKY